MQTIKLNLIPGSVLPVVNVSQYDVGRHFALQVYEGATAYDLTGKDVQIRGTKPDGNGFAYDSTDGAISVSTNTVTVTTLQQMTAVGGQTMCELRITSGSDILGTINFILMVEPSALSDDTPISDTDIPAIERDMQDQVDAAETSALEAEGYAVGEQDGVPVGPSSPYYHNNAKWYSDNMQIPDLDDLGNVNITTPTNGQALIYDSVNNEWVNGAGGGGSSTLAGLIDVTLTTPSSGQVLEYDGSKWENASLSIPSDLDDLSDVAIATPSSGEFLKYDGSKWVNGSGGGGGASALNDLSDVTLTTPSAGQALVYDGSKWENDTLNIPADLDDLSDVALTTPSAGQALVYDGSKWENDTLNIPADLDDLSDVQLTTPASGQFLKYDGSKWVNATGGGGGASALDDLTDVDITTPTDGQVLTYDANTQTWINADGGGGGGGFVLADWLTAGGLNPMSYADLAAVLSDEEAVRRLMTIHLAVDYLAGQTAVDASINTILTDNTCAKWINLRDYALDTLYDNALFASIMDMSGKYFLGEWAKLSTSPETWGPKGNVPIMTSNTAPYGTASAYQVFDGDSTTTASGTDFSYKFVNPVCVKDFVVKDGSGNAITGGTLQGYNDGSTWETPQSGKYYLYLRVHFEASTTVATVQFYGRELKESIPSMTSATAPYGSVFYGGDTDLSNGSAYKAFDGNDTTKASVNTWQYTTKAPCWIGYEFLTSVVAKEAVIYIGNPAAVAAWVSDSTFVIQGSNDNATWNDLCSAQTSSDYATKKIISINPNAASYKYYRCYFNKQPHSYQGKYDIDSFITLQIYGENYSEYDWDADNPRHYLYDHGVEFQPITFDGSSTYKVLAENDGEAIHLKSSGGAAQVISASAEFSNINLANYNTVRLTAGDVLSATSGNRYVFLWITLAGTDTNVAFMAIEKGGTYLPYNISLDSSSLNSTYDLSLLDSNSGAAESTITEWWLE